MRIGDGLKPLHFDICCFVWLVFSFVYRKFLKSGLPKCKIGINILINIFNGFYSCSKVCTKYETSKLLDIFLAMSLMMARIVENQYLIIY